MATVAFAFTQMAQPSGLLVISEPSPRPARAAPDGSRLGVVVHHHELGVPLRELALHVEEPRHERERAGGRDERRNTSLPASGGGLLKVVGLVLTWDAALPRWVAPPLISSDQPLLLRSGIDELPDAEERLLVASEACPGRATPSMP